MDRIALQARLDLQKWYDSVENGRDMCGSYSYCAFCDKSAALPCADAYEQMKSVEKGRVMPVRRPKKVVEKAGARDQKTSLGKKFDYGNVLKKKAARKSLTFAEKYALSSDILKERYQKLQEALVDTPHGAPKIKSRISKQCDTYRREGEIVAKITIIGTSLRINLPLDPAAPEYNDGRTPHVDAGHKKVYETVPFQFKVNSKLALKRALDLIEQVKNK